MIPIFLARFFLAKFFTFEIEKSWFLFFPLPDLWSPLRFLNLKRYISKRVGRSSPFFLKSVQYGHSWPKSNFSAAKKYELKS